MEFVKNESVEIEMSGSISDSIVSLADWACHCQRKGTLEDITDPKLKGKIKPECLSDHGTHHPSMGDILWTLEWIFQTEMNGDGSSVKKTSSLEGSVKSEKQEKIDMMAMHRNTLSLGGSDDDDDEAEKKEDDGANDIFSQIMETLALKTGYVLSFRSISLW